MRVIISRMIYSRILPLQSRTILYCYYKNSSSTNFVLEAISTPEKMVPEWPPGNFLDKKFPGGDSTDFGSE
jgi:hypothetical protein